MGYGYQGTCYTSELSAQDAFFGSQPATIIEDSTGITQYKLVSLSGNWTFQKSHIDLVGNETIHYQIAPQYPTFQTCDEPSDKTAQFLEGVELGSAVAAVMVIMWAIRAIRPYR